MAIETVSPDHARPTVDRARLGLYFTAGIVYAASSGLWAPLPFLMLFQAGFLYMGLQSLMQQSMSPDLILTAQATGE